MWKLDSFYTLQIFVDRNGYKFTKVFCIWNTK